MEGHFTCSCFTCGLKHTDHETVTTQQTKHTQDKQGFLSPIAPPEMECHRTLDACLPGSYTFRVIRKEGLVTSFSSRFPAGDDLFEVVVKDVLRGSAREEAKNPIVPWQQDLTKTLMAKEPSEPVSPNPSWLKRIKVNTHAPTPRWLSLLLLLLLAKVSLGFRLLALPSMTGDGFFWIFSDDTPYHLRRILMSVETWPFIPEQDMFVNFPFGATIYWPDGMPWLVATLVKLTGATGAQVQPWVEWFAGWFPPFVGMATVLLVYQTSQRWIGKPLAFLAALLLSASPIHVQYTSFGRLDHHIFEPLLCWMLLWSILAASQATNRSKQGWYSLLGAMTIVIAFLVWPGVLLHLGILVAAVLMSIVMVSRFLKSEFESDVLARASLWVFGSSILLSLPALWTSPWATQPVFFALSPLHLICLGVAAGAFALLGYTPSRWKRIPLLVRIVVASLVPTLVLFAPPVVHRSLLEGLQYTAQSKFAALATEFEGLFHLPGAFLHNAGFVIAIGTLIAFVGVILFSFRPHLAFPKVAEENKGSILYWTLMMVAAVMLFLPAMRSTRWLTAWAPFGAVVLVGFWPALLRPLGERIVPGQPKLWAVLSLVVLAAAFAPTLSLSLKMEPLSHSEKAAQLFFRRMKALTPPASHAPHKEKQQPRYGILTSWTLGHILTYLSERPTLANNFFGIPRHDTSNQLASRILLEGNCDRAAQTMEKHNLRYVLIKSASPATIAKLASASELDPSHFVDAAMRPREGIWRSLLFRLGLYEGQSMQLPLSPPHKLTLAPCGRFRLVDETHVIPAPRHQPGHLKLYEQVKGARLRLKGKPGAQVQVSLPLHLQGRRSFLWVARGRLNAKGILDLRLPYPTDGACWSELKPCPIRSIRKAYSIASPQKRFPPQQLAVTSQATNQGQLLTVSLPAKQ